MSCDIWTEEIALDAGGDLSAAEAAALRRHLGDCAPCRRFAAEMAASHEALQRFVDRDRTEESLGRVRGAVLNRLDREFTTTDTSSNVIRFPARARTTRTRKARRRLALAASLLAAITLWQLRDSRAPLKEPPGESGPLTGIETPPPKPVPVPTPTPTPPTLATTGPRSPEISDPDPGNLAPPWRRGGWIDVSGASETPSPSPSVIVLATEGSAPLTDAVFLPEPQRLQKPSLRRISEQNHHTIYWLEGPANPLKENEDAYTKIL